MNEQMRTAIEAAGKHLKPAVPVLKTLQAMKKFNDDFMWGKLHPGIKTYVANDIMDKKYGADLDLTGKNKEQLEFATRLSTHLNNAMGGQEWSKYTWSTPATRQLLQLFMFAPDWTLSNLQVAGIPDAFGEMGLDVAGLRQGKGSTEFNQMMKVYWPGMVMALTAFPALLQAMIYHTLGDDEEKDEPWMLSNELGKELSVDITPITRKMGLKGKQFLRWGKQAREIKRWFEAPFQQLQSKSSVAARTVIEQMSSYDGIGRMQPWTDEPTLVAGWERIKAVGGQVVPFSFKAIASGKPPTIFAPISKGMSKWKLQDGMAKTLDTYADSGIRASLEGHPDYVWTLDEMVPGLINAAAQAGIPEKDVEKALKQAASKVKSKYYAQFWEAFNKDDQKKATKIAESIIRLHGGIDGFARSMKSKAGKDLDLPTMRWMEERVRAAEENLGAPFSESAADRKRRRERKRLRKKMLKEFENIHGGSYNVENYLWNYQYGPSHWSKGSLSSNKS